MRTISCHPPLALALGLSFLSTAHAFQDVTQDGQPIVVPSQSSVFNQNSVNLPSAPITSGQDIVRGADGTSCQSAIASGGPYLDVGVLQSQDFYQRDSAAVYGRIVIPIGKRSKRLDCTRLYQLEIERMRMELELLRMGTSYAATPVGLQGDPDKPTEVDGFAIGGAAEPTVRRPAAKPSGSEPKSSGGSTSRGLVMQGVVNETETRAASVRDKEEAPDLVTLRKQHDQHAVPQGFYAQAGAFGSRESADLRMLSAVTASGFTKARIKPQVIGERTLFRVMLGPTTEAQAEQICRSIPGDCFIAHQRDASA